MKKLAAVIVENRPKQNLIQVINNHMDHLPAGTDLFIYHGQYQTYLPKVFPQAHLTEIKGEFGLPEYNRMLTSAEFWSKFLNYDKILIFQSDSGVLRPGIEEFLEMDYGYIGAPIWHNPTALNGGLSLRDPKLMYEICSTYTYDTGNEDMIICDILDKSYPGKLAPREVAKLFSVESVFALGSWGYHGILPWLYSFEQKEIMNQYK